MATLGFNRMEELRVIELKKDFFWKQLLEAIESELLLVRAKFKARSGCLSSPSLKNYKDEDSQTFLGRVSVFNNSLGGFFGWFVFLIRAVRISLLAICDHCLFVFSLYIPETSLAPSSVDVYCRQRIAPLTPVSFLLFELNKPNTLSLFSTFSHMPYTPVVEVDPFLPDDFDEYAVWARVGSF